MNRIQNLMLTFFLIISLSISSGCQPKVSSPPIDTQNVEPKVLTGAEKIEAYLTFLQDKKVGVLVNHTSMVGSTHLVDTLLAHDVSIVKIFSPEHGFRGDVSDGLTIDNSKDIKTGLPIISLYGKNKKPTSEHLSDLDVVIYDIQDVGVRFYTYISAMHYMMEACAAYNVKMLILDRPNPNGHYVDGPILDSALSSYVGMHPIPIVYGMTAGELAQMIIGENWFEFSKALDLQIIPLQNWSHQTSYDLPIKPSPNLPNSQAIALYPSLCLFEGTKVSVGRGTYDPFQIIGVPDGTAGVYTFTPKSIPNMSKYPPFENELCFGLDLRKVSAKNEIDLSYLIDFYNKSKDKTGFFNAYFKKLAGTELLQRQIENGLTSDEIKDSWQQDLDAFKIKRKPYLLYKDFE